MRSPATLWLSCMFILVLIPGCVDPYQPTINATVNVVVVDGTITNLAEPQIIRLNRSKADSLTGRFGSLPLTKARVEVVGDSFLVIACHETLAGSYQLPSDFKGQIGHAYQLRFTLSDGTRYVSTKQIMPAVPPINRVTAQFNPTSFPSQLYTGTINQFRGAHELFVDTKDPLDTPNYYRWNWKLYEHQDWCHSCYQGIYVVNQLNPLLPYTYPYYYSSSEQPYEDCFYPPLGTPAYVGLINHQYDYPCRTQCWEIINSDNINVFSDQYTNGGLITKKRVAQIPYYQANPCLVDIRQESLPEDAYRYYYQYQQQTENTGGIADTPPGALGGNVHNVTNQAEVIVGYFTASAVAVVPYFLDRKDTKDAKSIGLFYALTGRQSPNPEGRTDQNFIVNSPRPPTAVCGPIDQRTPVKPEGWWD